MEKNDQKYNGWSNYETWAVGLWLDNDEFTSSFWQDATERIVDEAHTNPKVKSGEWDLQEFASRGLADQLKEEIENSSPLQDASLYSDLLNAAMQAVNWSEIADRLLEDTPTIDQYE